MGEKLVVAFLGPKASYTHQATISEFPEHQYDVRAQTNIEDVFTAVQTGAAARGVVPFENSTNGSVVFTLDFFADLHNKFPDILVDGEIYLTVQHCLLGHIAKPPSRRSSTADPQPVRRTDLPWRRLKDEDNGSPITSTGGVTPTQEEPTPAKPKATPQYDIKHIKKLYSHPQAWGQCKILLNTHLKGIERIDVSSTSKAAELVAQDEHGTSAAISSSIAAQLYNLNILAQGIEDNHGNSTRFLILRRQDSPSSCPTAPSLNEDTEMQNYKTLVTFTVAHDAPGALADSLAVLKKHNLNLTNFQSRPSGEAPWHYIWFVEFMGRKKPVEEGGAVNRALVELDDFAQAWRWLGSWENRLRG